MAQLRDIAVERRHWLAAEFERHRAHLRSVGYRMLGSMTEAEDAVQEAWIRLDRRDPGGADDLRGWLTVTVGRICLDQLRSRRSKRETYAGTWLPEPLVTRPLNEGRDHASPEQDAVLADSVGIALLVVLDSLSPPERLAFVLHDVFGVAFNEIAPIVDRTPSATRQLASRARRRVRAEAPIPTPTSSSSAAWSMHSSRPPEPATSRRSFGCSIPTSSSASTAAAAARLRGRPFTAQTQSPTRHEVRPSLRGFPGRRSSMARQAW